MTLEGLVFPAGPEEEQDARQNMKKQRNPALTTACLQPLRVAGPRLNKQHLGRNINFLKHMEPTNSKGHICEVANPVGRPIE